MRYYFVNIYIRKDLLCYYLENPINFDITNSLNLVMKKYNNLIHKSTKHTPFEVFYSSSEDLFNEVKNNSYNYFEFTRKLEYNFKVEENCLLNNNFIIVKQKNKFGNYYLIKNKIKKNKSLYIICVKIMSILGGGNYIIEILNDYNDYKLYKGEKYEAPLNLLKKCDKDTFDNIVKLNEIDKNSYVNILNTEEDENLSEISSENEVENTSKFNNTEKYLKKEDIFERRNSI